MKYNYPYMDEPTQEELNKFEAIAEREFKLAWEKALMYQLPEE